MPIGPAQRNIDAIVRLEQEFLAQRSRADRISDAVVDAFGTMKVLLVHFVVFVVWMLLNSGRVPGVAPWDPFPFILLTLFVSTEGVIVALLVLMKQNRMSRRADEREHLHLQINLLAEKEVTKMLQMQREICRHLGIQSALEDREALELSRDTAVDRLARELKDKLPEE